MKRLNTTCFIIGLLLLTVFFSCQKEDTKMAPAEPQIVSIWPESGPANSIITIIGYHFSPVRTDNKVQINGQDAVVIKASASELQVAVPQGTGTGDVTLTINGQVIKGPAFTYIKEATDEQDARKFYVKKNGSGDGTSWEDASSLSHALKIATDGSTLFIAAGTYAPSATITGGSASDPSDNTFEINKNITLLGGYPANVSDTTTPADPSANQTILSGKLLNGEDAYHVMAITAPHLPGQKVELDGLTITGGNAAGSSSNIIINGTKIYRSNGGGIIVGNSDVVINNCEVINNKSRTTAAGMFIIGGAIVRIKNSKINNNTTNGTNSSGIWVYQSKLFVYNSEINNNECPGTAPAVYGYPYAAITLYNTTVAHNEGGSYGAGVYIRKNSSAAIVNCLIYNNQSSSDNGGGGLMMYDNCNAAIISSTITDNKIAGPGGGIYRRNGDNTIAVYNSIISGNIQQAGSSDMDVYESDAPAPVIQSAVVSADTYDNSGNMISGTTFDPDQMFSNVFLPIGTDNPALSYGMPANALTTLGGTFAPALETTFLSEDINGNSRAGSNIMGAVIK